MSQESFPNQILQQQIQLQNVYRSFDGADSRIRMDHFFKVQSQFIKCLNNLIRHQNNKKKSSILVLPYQGTHLYVHFKDEINLKKAKVFESTDSTFGQFSFLNPQMPFLPFSAYQTIAPHYSQEFAIQRMNPIMQSQDRFIGQSKQVNQQTNHFKVKDKFIVFSGKPEESQSIHSDEQDEDDKQSDHSFSIKKKKKISKVNDTKNITKNFSKAIISYITQNKDIGLKLLDPREFEDFLQILKEKKNKMTNIQQLRELWVDCEDEKLKSFNKTFRIFSQYFLRQQSVAYIYNSRIMNTGWHLKYRYNLLRALREPQNFKYIKDI
ncbi:unnamed protein product (macronuclear) [Paramecium tetraurelia]|uniref:Uncharacterized protein n=1 Tax=Paramecium tetraurelia TaxID=5888 RepID=A0DK63_PARTE|nr:uncharacterized protein GSPATT00017759001 [Paramecium tetraurelia]CAK83430.1 unnamed protein product [Paramecium tetraurelia]|eukprot:XP_001450827.1 hypothetical protein (macronuclear) [Paramecium tetraurelia strain d4-2]